jgi:hypothetical protein
VFLYPSAEDAVAWLAASDESWGRYGASRYAAAAGRASDPGQPETPQDAP